MSTKKTTSEQVYQRDYYQRRKAARTQALKDKWKNDPQWKEKEQERARERRGRLRAERAGCRFRVMIESRREDMAATRPPRWANVGTETVQVWTTGSLGREIGRTPRAVRSWLRKGVLPGATLFIGSAAFFSRRFCAAVYRACERLYYLDGRGDHKVLKRLVREELRREGISFVPVGADNETGRIVLV